jgi:hypothetical protein
MAVAKTACTNVDPGLCLGANLDLHHDYHKDIESMRKGGYIRVRYTKSSVRDMSVGCPELSWLIR